MTKRPDHRLFTDHSRREPAKNSFPVLKKNCSISIAKKKTEKENSNEHINRVSLEQFARPLIASMIREAFARQSDSEMVRACAAFLGKTPQTVNAWLRHESAPSAVDIFALATKLGIYRTMEITTQNRTRTDILNQITGRPRDELEC